jgi:hypothetical protein
MLLRSISEPEENPGNPSRLPGSNLAARTATPDRVYSPERSVQAPFSAGGLSPLFDPSPAWSAQADVFVISPLIGNVVGPKDALHKANAFLAAHRIALAVDIEVSDVVTSRGL